MYACMHVCMYELDLILALATGLRGGGAVGQIWGKIGVYVCMYVRMYKLTLILALA